ncbi:MAG TPA: hypothetical protein VIP70_13905, partial [Nitrososphaeraceae archaeon]
LEATLVRIVLKWFEGVGKQTGSVEKTLVDIWLDVLEELTGEHFKLSRHYRLGTHRRTLKSEGNHTFSF